MTDEPRSGRGPQPARRREPFDATLLVTDAPVASRALDTLARREMILASQVAGARVAVRWRARELYRFLRAEPDAAVDLEPRDDQVRLSAADRARVLTAGRRALARELDETRILASELALARADRAALSAKEAPPSSQASEPPGRAPVFVSPVAGRLAAQFGAARDRATGVWLVRSGVRLRARAGGPVRAVGAGVVRRIERASPDGAAAVMIDHGGGWTSIVTGVDAPVVAPGAPVKRGAILGRVSPVSPVSPTNPKNLTTDGIALELWRGRAAVNPASYIRF